jgi:integrase
MKGHVRKRRTWEFIVDIGQHPVSGRRCQKSKAGFPTKGAAERAAREFIQSVEGGGSPPAERMEMATYLRGWLEYQRARGIRHRTLKVYEGYIRREILPTIGRVELAMVSPPHIRKVLTGMRQRGLAAGTIAQVRCVLGSAFRQAREDGLVASNPVTAVRCPKAPRRDLHWPTAADLGALLRASRGTMWEVPILLACVTGARRSEILGISWEDVDLMVGTVFIRRGIQAVRTDGNDRVAFTALKTKRARRSVRLPAFALERIHRHRKEQLKARTALGRKWRDPVDEFGHPVPLVCARGDGLPLYPDSFTSAFKRLARQAGLHPATRLHDVRHAVATELGRRGVHPVIVSAVLGHASPAFTVAVYQHAWQEGPEEAAGALEAALAQKFLSWQSVGTKGNRRARRPRCPPESAGQKSGAGWTRTSDRRIMSPLL